MWPEVETARAEKRHELVLSGPLISERIAKDGMDWSLCKLPNLNYVCISETSLEAVSDDISKLKNLQNLVLHSNRLDTVNPKIAELEKLKMLDISRNQLKDFPKEFDEAPSLMTLILSGNELETFPSLSKCSKLTCLDLSHNKLTTFPDICYSELSGLADLKLKGNEIDGIPTSISVLSSLKNFDVSCNKVKKVPGELADCTKLKEINLKDNPIEDRRLLKLIDQCRTKQIMDYIKQHCPRTSQNQSQTSGKKGKKNAKDRLNSEEEADKDEMQHKYTIEVLYSTDDFCVVATEKVQGIREQFIGCLVHDVAFTEESFKKFIQLQNKLHKTVCSERNKATIATHDFKKIGSKKLIYTTLPPDDLIIKPLNFSTEMTGTEYYKKLQTEADNLRKEKKRNTYSGIHQYLYLVDKKTQYPVVLNEQQQIISLPPLTNSDLTKIHAGTTTMLIEVTSNLTQFVAKSAMDALLKEMVLLFETNLKVQQVRVVDVDGNLRVVYPSRSDLNFDQFGIKVERS